MKDLDRVRREKTLMERVDRHPRIIQIIDYFEDRSFLCFLMDYYKYDAKKYRREILDNIALKNSETKE